MRILASILVFVAVSRRFSYLQHVYSFYCYSLPCESPPAYIYSCVTEEADTSTQVLSCVAAVIVVWMTAMHRNNIAPNDRKV